MERLTKKEQLAGNTVSYVTVEDCFDVWSVPKKFMGNAIERLAAIEDILGDEYDLDRLSAMVNQRKWRKKEEIMIPPKAPKTCERCGVTYIPTGTRQKYCKECGAIVQAGFRRAYEKKRREARKKPVKENPVQQPVLTLAQAAKEARERGMTYGQYISWRCS